METECTSARGRRSIKAKSTSLLQKLPNNTTIKVKYSYVIPNIDMVFDKEKSLEKSIVYFLLNSIAVAFEA